LIDWKQQQQQQQQITTSHFRPQQNTPAKVSRLQTANDQLVVS
jgi:hypothetical protein